MNKLTSAVGFDFLFLFLNVVFRLNLVNLFASVCLIDYIRYLLYVIYFQQLISTFDFSFGFIYTPTDIWSTEIGRMFA